jgi:hypothetical protein
MVGVRPLLHRPIEPYLQQKEAVLELMCLSWENSPASRPSFSRLLEEISFIAKSIDLKL